jgi:hypothetical protein
VDETGTTLLTIPGLSYNTVAVILAEVGDFSNFATPDIPFSVFKIGKTFLDFFIFWVDF